MIDEKLVEWRRKNYLNLLKEYRQRIFPDVIKPDWYGG